MFPHLFDSSSNTHPSHYYSLLFISLVAHFTVPTRITEYNRLGPWVKTQREDFRKMKDKKQSPMCQWRIELLEKIGFDFKVSNREPSSFEQRLAELEEFKAEFGHCNVPQSWARNVPLGKCKYLHIEIYISTHLSPYYRCGQPNCLLIDDPPFPLSCLLLCTFTECRG